MLNPPARDSEQCALQTKFGSRANDWYRLRYGLVWLFGFLSVSGGIILVVLSTMLATGMMHSTRQLFSATAGYSGALLLFVVFALMYLPAARLRFRAGSGLLAGIAGEWSAFAPSSLEELRENCQRARIEGTPLTVVGNAWSNVLGQRTTIGRRIYMRRMVGRVPGDENSDNPKAPTTWLAGTTLKQVQYFFNQRCVQLIGVPSSSYVTLGAWVATMAHGNSGPKADDGLIFVNARVLDMATGIEFEQNADRLMDMFGRGALRASQYLILSVTIGQYGLYENVSLRRQGRRVVTLDDAKWALDSSAWMRAIFVGDNKMLALRWIKNQSDDEKAENVLLKLWLLVFAAMGWGWAMPNYEGHQTTELVSEAVYLFPDNFQPYQLWFNSILNIVNFEFYANASLTPKTLLAISEELQQVHRRFGGRTELRSSAKLLYLDFALKESDAAFEAVFRALANLGLKRMAQHPGKYLFSRTHAECAGIELVNIKDL